MRPSIFLLLAGLASLPSYGAGNSSPGYAITPLAADLCGARFRNLAGSDYNRQHVTDALIATQGDPNRTVAFVELYGQKLLISNDNRVGGRPSHFTEPKTEENDGSFNHGIFYYTGTNGPQVIKLISEVPNSRLPLTPEQKLAVAHMGRGLEGAILGEATDAPKIYRFGTASYRGKQYYYVDMERAFAGQPTLIFKNTVRSGQSVGLLNKKEKPILLASMSRHFIDAFSKQICPSDPDFIIGPNGQVRWIDPFAWKARLWKDTSAPNPDRGKNGTSFTHFMDLFSENDPQLAKDFIHTFLTELKIEEKLSSFEKHLLLEDLFLAQHHRDPVVEALLRKYMQRIGVTGSDHAEPLSGILRIYDALP